jgi:hypothetical protein
MAMNAWVTTAVHRSEPKLGAFQRWFAAFSAGLVLLLAVLAASPDLHALIHHDADHADHSCAITLFHQGLDAPAAIVFAASAPVMVELGLAIPDPATRPDAHLDRLQPGRGPPFC